MRIFITGGTGFIGKPLLELLSPKHQLLVLSRRPPKKNQNNITFIKGNLSNLPRLKSYIKRFKPEAIIHLAWEGLPDYSVSQSFKNLKYSLDLMLLAQEIGCSKFLGAGTCWEYGQRSGKLSEELASQPLNIFALAKDCFRRLGEAVSREGKISFVWMRFFYVYGPGQKSSSLIPHLIRSLKKGKRPVVKTPEARNDFIYVEDVARAIAEIAARAKSSAIYNIGSGKLTRVGEIVKIIYPEYTYRIKRRESAFYADLRKIRKEIGWQPKVDIKNGIRTTVNWFLKNEK